MVSMLRAAVPISRQVIAGRAMPLCLAIVALAFVLLAAPGNAQQIGKVPRIGFLSSTPSGISEGFREGLKELGRVEGRNTIVEWRWTEGKAERSSELAAELVRLKPDLIVTTSNQPTAAVKAVTDTIPIVFVSVADPVVTGLVASLARPGGNVTGLAALAAEGFTGKMLELLQVAVPQAARVAILMNPTSADHRRVVSPELPTVAERLRLTLLPIEVQTANQLDGAFERAARSRADAIVVLGDPLVYVNRVRVAELAAKQRLPAMYFFRESVEAGGLMSYGPSLHDLGRRAATYVDKILKGARPTDLPVEQPTKFDFTINLKTARALGLAMPPDLLRRADQVIE
jgi:putative tryptophan/tyrosine transport system substrate-binding protein